MATIISIIRADWGDSMHGAAKRIAAVAVAVYVAGYCTGAFIHALNDRLAGVSRPVPASARIIAAIPAMIEADVPQAITATAESVPLAIDRHTVAQLRKLARQHGAPSQLSASGRRADLLAFLAGVST